MPDTDTGSQAAANSEAAVLDARETRLRDILRQCGSVAVAYSGGVDSTYLAAVAQRSLPDERVLLINALSPSFPEDEAAFVRQFAADQGIRLVTVETDELSSEDYANNPPNRCYFCKTEMYAKLWPVARREGMAVLVDGANADDLQDFRPGTRAAMEQEVRHPLQEAGMTKADIRAASKRLGLPTWDKPAYACLASRFPYGERITAKKLARVESAEAFLREAGFRVFRVRSHQQLARLEFGGEEMARAFAERQTLTRRMKQLGFAFVTLDLCGFASGSMNVLLKQDQAVAAD